MLILGEKYTFNNFELKKLDKKFSIINTILYENEKPNNVILQIEENLNNKIKLIVLNSKIRLDDKITKYLQKLELTHKYITIITIELFLEKYLYKCYIPEDNSSSYYMKKIKGFSTFQKFQKKIIDIIAMMFLFVILFFIKPFIKYRIKKESFGSIYFKQFRIGLNNIEFECIKFRSMHEHSSNNDATTTSIDDNRIFSFGEIMRKTRIDELPQVFNIFKNELSLVGPRAEWNRLTIDYEKEIPFYNKRHIVKPGITGWAQVMFVEGRNKDDTKQKLMYDLYYIKNWNLWLELKIIFKTILVVLDKKGV